MKNFIKLMKAKFDSGDKLRKKDTPHGKLYIAHLNKAMIKSSATTGHTSNDRNNNGQEYKAWVLTSSDGTVYDGNMPVILSSHDEMMMCNDELTEYY